MHSGMSRASSRPYGFVLGPFRFVPYINELPKLPVYTKRVEVSKIRIHTQTTLIAKQIETFNNIFITRSVYVKKYLTP